MKFAIIGAGLAGLTSAYELRKQDKDAVIDVYEATDRIGGKLFTVPFEAGPTDMGAEAFLARRKDAVEFFTELGLADSLVHPSGLRSLVYSGGETKELPAGGVMGIPAQSEPVAHLISTETAARIDDEANQDGIDWPVGGDMNVGQLMRERYGADLVDHVVSALLGGVYSCAADDLGIRATIPQLAEEFDRLAEAGEKITLSGAVKNLEAARPKPAGGKPAPVFGTFRGGYAEAYEALAEQSGADIYVDAFISGVEKTAPGYRITGGEDKVYDRLIIATPAPTTALLLKNIAPEASAALKAVKLADSVVVGMRFASAEGLPENSGVLVASDEDGVHAKAFTFSSKKWPHLGERGGALVRASFGRFGDNTALRADEDDLVDWALDDLQTITGFDGREAGLEEIYVQRWFGGLPRYDETHLATVAKVKQLIDDQPTLALTGAWSGGVGVPAVIADAKAAAARVAG
ncbi:protoporphyrinogen oxidase [Corynebacterium breve]|uniref:Coproporphyrinogen III oxidase n=1 Tax=Corynebacterium breve TaxID=3049799 RepID=A0ABY8VEF3_9CORY|nr:protoporphyrinogen oxidase [Corynebacterium breve]WIM68025.1 protoporphyrinogen oxidase [Corynebacterium breve]